MAEQKSESLSIIKGKASQSEMSYQFTLIVDVETNSYFTYPYFPLSIIMKKKNETLLAIKTISTLSVLSLNFQTQYEIEQTIQIDLQEKFNIQSDITSALALKNDNLNLEDNQCYEEQQPQTILLGLANGSIINVDFENSKLVSNFDSFKIDETDLDIYVTHLIKIPTGSSKQQQKILAIYQDSSVIEYLVECCQINTQFFTAIKKQRNLISLTDKQNIASLNSSVKKTFNNIKYTTYNNIEERLNYFKMKPSQPPFSQNPQAFYKFQCNYITDIQILENNYFYSSEGNKDQLIICFTGFDGGFRIYNYPQLKPILFYSTACSGINCFSFTNSGEIVALGGQDDTITLLSLTTQSSIRIIAHKSAITKIIMFHECLPNLKHSDNIVILAGGMDNQISITEIPKNKFTISLSTRKSQLLYLDENEIETCTINADNIFNLSKNGGGIGDIILVDNIMCLSFLDGCAQIWEVNLNTNKEDKLNLEQLSMLQNKVSKSFIKKQKL